MGMFICMCCCLHFKQVGDLRNSLQTLLQSMLAMPEEKDMNYHRRHLKRRPWTITEKFPLVRSDKLQNESSPIFSHFRLEFCSEFCSEFSEDFSCFMLWDSETTKNSPKKPAIFQCQIAQANSNKNPQKFSWEQAKFALVIPYQGFQLEAPFGPWVSQQSLRSALKEGPLSHLLLFDWDTLP